MLPFNKDKKADRTILMALTILITASVLWVMSCGDTLASAKGHNSHQKTFTTPDEAVTALVAAAKSDDVAELSAILGTHGKQLIFSGDEVADRNGRERFVRMYEEKNQVVKESEDKAILEVGPDAWPFPIPVVKTGAAWRFDTKAGKEELLNRRIGRNELSTIESCLAYVDAQREYASKDRDGDGLFEYAQKVASDPGQKNGLYWEAEEGEEQSPLGPLVASAKKEGYTKSESKEKPTPYHGYYYKILKAQGKHAPGGAYDYVVRGKMIGGFALVAYPAEYGSSGIMTFIVSHAGDVYEKNLGKNTASKAQAMKTFDPDKTWHKEEPKVLDTAAAASGS